MTVTLKCLLELLKIELGISDYNLINKASFQKLSSTGTKAQVKKKKRVYFVLQQQTMPGKFGDFFPFIIKLIKNLKQKNIFKLFHCNTSVFHVFSSSLCYIFLIT